MNRETAERILRNAGVQLANETAEELCAMIEDLLPTARNEEPESIATMKAVLKARAVTSLNAF